MASVWTAFLGVLCLVILAHDLGVKAASVVKRSVDEEGRKIVRFGDELVIANGNDNKPDDDGDDEEKDRDKRSDDSEKKVVRVGDQLILVNKGEDDDVNDGSHDVHKRSAIKDESYRWTDKTVPYIFDGTFGAKDQAIVKAAMDEWSKHTCIKFRPARASDQHKVKYVQGDGCFSFVGMVEKTQDISLDKDGCRYVSTALHEIGHALGMYHTQVRPDRDQYIKVDLSDVAKKLQDNFVKQTWDKVHHYGVDYDFLSIMHYDGTSFTSNGGTSIKTHNAKWQKIIGNVKHLSFGDIEMMNKMYHCAPKSCTLKDSDCPGVSFVDQTCSCACPGTKDNPVVACSNKGRGGSKPQPPTPRPATTTTTAHSQPSDSVTSYYNSNSYGTDSGWEYYKKKRSVDAAEAELEKRWSKLNNGDSE